MKKEDPTWVLLKTDKDIFEKLIDSEKLSLKVKEKNTTR